MTAAVGNSLHTKYRPDRFDDVIGQDAVVKAFQSALDKSHAFLLVGPSGTGKTTLARIAAADLGGASKDILEIDAATYTGVDAMRTITQASKYRPLHGKVKCTVIDECFYGNVKVCTPSGLIPISDLRPGDVVFGAMGPAVIKRCMRRWLPITRVVKMTIGGVEIICSDNHPFLTRRGWVDAAVAEKEELQTISSVDKKLLSLWDSIFDSRLQSPLLRSVLARNKGMRDLRSGVLDQARTQDCFEDVFTEMRKPIGRAESERAAFSRAEIQSEERSGQITPLTSRDVGRRVSEPFKAHEKEQSSQQTRCDASDHCYKSQKRNQWLERKSWWQWEIYKAADQALAYLEKFANRISDFYWSPSAGWFRLSNLLQSRCSQARFENCSRGRWFDAQCRTHPKTGSQEGAKAASTRVDRIEVFQRGSSSEQWFSAEENQRGYAEFYDLEIDGHPSFNVNGFIVHNCHMLSPNSFNSLLKNLEEPESWMYWFLCTTELRKVPETIRTRCVMFTLSAVSNYDLFDLLKFIADKEDLKVLDNEKILDLCARESRGSPRQAIVYLSACGHTSDLEEAAKLIASAADDPQAFELAKLLVSGAPWSRVRPLILDLKDLNPESIRHVVRAYLTTVALGSKDERTAGRVMNILEHFRHPFHHGDGITPVLMACAEAVFGSKD